MRCLFSIEMKRSRFALKFGIQFPSMKQFRIIAIIVFVLGFFKPATTIAQQDSCAWRISLLTCTPGEELYSTFGHTAIRVKTDQFDIVFNYGTFEFDDPDFYSKFVKGKLPYFLSVEQYSDFAYSYLYEKRGIEEQLLLLECAEKQQLFEALKVNAREENKFYKYDFLFDNCTTRAGQIIIDNTGNSVSFVNILSAETPSFRQLLHQYLDKGNQQWSKLGIDILLGSRIDRKVSNREAMFLPDNLKIGLSGATSKGKRIASDPQTIVTSTAIPTEKSLWTPLLLFTILLIVISAASLVRNAAVQKSLHIFDRIWFTILGLLGALLVFMWLGTDHGSCKDNWNLIWVLPTHLIVIFSNWNKPWIRNYYKVIFILSIITMVSWFLLPQQLNVALIPIVGLTAFRSFFIMKSN